MHLILTGATGLVGSGVLYRMINVPAITKVSVLSRRPVPMAEGHPKVEVIIHKDFESYPPELMAKLKGAEGVVWAQGVSQADVTKEKYIEITYRYPMAAAKAFSGLSDPFKFVYVSGEGATTTPGMFTAFFGKVKGECEAALLELSKTTPSFKPYSLRPGGVDPTDHPEISDFLPKREGLIQKLVAGIALPVLRSTANGMLSPTKELGVELVDLAMGDGKPLNGEGISGEGRTISNGAMRRLVGLDKKK